jgi:L-ascorbate metabolism protein UlaG (beta-lactamase superfamily)
VRFPITGPLRYTMTARDAVRLCERLRPAVAFPVHYEGWSHFVEGRQAIERRLATAPAEVRDVVRWLPIGTPTEVEA